ncbi:TRAP transporter small permease [Pseudooceanicola sp. MF1-13]|uniref:TRAP transporter small permease n=1 Tax=Pseudooceanicola sp. MF1-13 TaxID=3379095 RepID=UPI0038919971
MTERAAYALALVGFSGLLILSIMVVLDIILRTTVDFPLKGVNDVSAMVMAVVIAACIPQALFLKQNISVEILGQVIGGRVYLFLQALASLAVLIFFTLLAWQFVPYSESVWSSGERTWVLGWPIGPWWYVATVGFFVSAVTQLMVFVDDVIALLTDNGTPRSQPDPQEGV